VKSLPLKKGEKDICRYVAIDMATGNVLVAGHKYKNFSKMRPEHSFFKGFLFRRKITTYEKIKNINGNTCYFLYWKGAKAKEISSTVFLAGFHKGLEGDYYTSEDFELKKLIELVFRGLKIEN